jgi:hypothetical protein
MTAVVTVNDVLDGHVGLDVECLDRIYLNGYVPNLQVAGQVVSFMTTHLGNPIPSPAILEKIGIAFRKAVDRFAADNKLPVVRCSANHWCTFSVLIGTGDGIMAVLGDRPQIGAGRAWRAVRVQNVVIDLGAVAFVGIGVVVGYWWAVSWPADAHGLGFGRACVGLDLGGDRRARPRMGNGVRRSDRILDPRCRPPISRPL